MFSKSLIQKVKSRIHHLFVHKSNSICGDKTHCYLKTKAVFLTFIYHFTSRPSYVLTSPSEKVTCTIHQLFTHKKYLNLDQTYPVTYESQNLRELLLAITSKLFPNPSWAFLLLFVILPRQTCFPSGKVTSTLYHLGAHKRKQVQDKADSYFKARSYVDPISFVILERPTYVFQIQHKG